MPTAQSLSPTALVNLATKIRIDALKMIVYSNSGHPGGSLGLADVFAVLYGAVLNHRPHQPTWDQRDRLLVSNGHVAPAWYAVLAEVGYFPKTLLSEFQAIDSLLQGHPRFSTQEDEWLPGIENTSGSLGQGISQACGLAFALKADQNPAHVFCLMGDGEQQEGQVWEAYQFGVAAKLDNLIGIIDRNHIQISGQTEDVIPLEPLKAKLIAFGWHVFEVDGHNHQTLIDTLAAAKTITGRPSVIITHTIPGKGVSFMEGKFQWHGDVPTKAQLQQALHELHDQLEAR